MTPLHFVAFPISAFADPRTQRLAEELECTHDQALLVLLRLWACAVQRTESGDMTDLRGWRLAKSCGWAGDAERFWDALHESEWMVRGQCADWQEGIGRAFDKRRADADRKAKQRVSITPEDDTGSRSHAESRGVTRKSAAVHGSHTVTNQLTNQLDKQEEEAPQPEQVPVSLAQAAPVADSESERVSPEGKKARKPTRAEEITPYLINPERLRPKFTPIFQPLDERSGVEWMHLKIKEHHRRFLASFNRGGWPGLKADFELFVSAQMAEGVPPDWKLTDAERKIIDDREYEKHNARLARDMAAMEERLRKRREDEAIEAAKSPEQRAKEDEERQQLMAKAFAEGQARAKERRLCAGRAWDFEVEQFNRTRINATPDEREGFMQQAIEERRRLGDATPEPKHKKQSSFGPKSKIASVIPMSSRYA